MSEEKVGTNSNTPNTSTNGVDRGLCLCLSGGGYRATLFHLGVVLRLNELGVLSRLSTITSVSGGSILNGVLATRWTQLSLGPDGVFSNFLEVMAKPVREFCSRDLRSRMLIGIRLNPLNWLTLIRDGFSVSANFLAEAYQPLYLTNLGKLPLPGPAVPRFVFCSTNVCTGACWHFHGGPNAKMGDFYDGYCNATEIRVADAVAASSAFPPGFSALRLKIATGTSFTREDPWGELRVRSGKRPEIAAFEGAKSLLLTDGGVYDNLAVEPVWNRYKSLLVSDAGKPFLSTTSSGQNIVSRLVRASDISMEQVAAVRKRWLVQDLLSGRRKGAIWTIHTRLVDFPLQDKRGYSEMASRSIQSIRTDLDPFSKAESACLENHGYSLADSAVRSYASNFCVNTSYRFEWPNADWVDDNRVVAALTGSDKRKLFRR